MASDEALRRVAEALLMQQQAAANEIPLPRPDPRGPPVTIGPPPSPPSSPREYGFGDHALAALRAVFEGEKYRENMMPYRDATGLYDR